jgi:hypothetical protein
MSPFQTAGVAISKNLERVASALLRAVEEADQVVNKAKSTRPGDAWPITVQPRARELRLQRRRPFAPRA